MLKSGNNSMSGIIYNSYKAIPFLYEIKLAIDWTFTSTSLDFFRWNKFESIYDVIYCTYCSMTAVNKKLVGQKIGPILKIGMGGVLSFSLVFVLIAPLMLFSSLNPTNELNNLTGAYLLVDLTFSYNNGAMKNYTLYKNSKPESIESIFQDGDYEWNFYNYSKSIYTKNFPKEQVQTLKFFEASDKSWDLAKPHVENLIELLINRKNYTDIVSIKLDIEYNLERPLPAESMHTSKRYETLIYYKTNETEEQAEKLDSLGNALKYCYDTYIDYEGIYSPPIRVSASSKPKRITDKKYFPNLPVRIGFVGCVNTSDTKNGTISSYLESYFTFQKVLIDSKNHSVLEGVKFHVFSDKVSSTTSGQSILTFYVSFVLLVGTYVRSFLAGQPEKIILTEMPHPEEIIGLCEGIKIARNSYDFNQEEKLYYILIELMRSPEYLRSLTSSSTEQFNQRLILTENSKSND